MLGLGTIWLPNCQLSYSFLVPWQSWANEYQSTKARLPSWQHWLICIPHRNLEEATRQPQLLADQTELWHLNALSQECVWNLLVQFVMGFLPSEALVNSCRPYNHFYQGLEESTSPGGPAEGMWLVQTLFHLQERLQCLVQTSLL
jgi:hypothetical protein